MMTLWGAVLNAGQLTPDEKKTVELKPGVVLVVVSYTVTWTLVKAVELPHTEVGSGFIYRPDGYIITNGHVVADAHLKDPDALDALTKRVRGEFQQALERGIIFKIVEQQVGRELTDKEKEVVLQSRPNISISTPTLKVYLANGHSFNAQVLQWDPPIGTGKDVAILKIPANDLPTVQLGNSDKVRVQDPIMVIGYPGVASNWGDNDLVSNESNFVPTATNGHISALKTSNIGTPLLQSDAAITHGNSGGPVFNEQSEVIGIATAGAESAQGFNFFVPINVAMEFVRQTGVAPEGGAFNRTWANALNLYDQGKCRDSIAEFDNVLQFMPDMPDAKNFRMAAVKCWDEKNPLERVMETYGAMVYVVGALAILVIVGLFLFLRRSATPVVAQPAGGHPPLVIDAGPAKPIQPSAGSESYGSIQGTAGALSGRSFKIPKEGLLIGRSPKCQVVVQDDTISSEHAWIVPVDNRVVVIDRGSSNGTYVNSVESPRVSKIGLFNGDRIYLGKKGTVVFTYFGS
jgi:S1-C subfamily serine protease